MNQGYLVGLFGRRKVSAYRGQHRNTKTNMHALSVIRTHDLSNQAAKTYALNSAATGPDLFRGY
jgi:hypothetical protein